MKQKKEKLTPEELKQEIIGSIAIIAILAVAAVGIYFGLQWYQKARISYIPITESVEYYSKGDGTRGLRINKKEREQMELIKKPTTLFGDVIVLTFSESEALFKDGETRHSGYNAFKMSEDKNYVYAIDKEKNTVVLDLALTALFNGYAFSGTPKIYGDKAISTKGENDLLLDKQGSVLLPELSFKANTGKQLEKEYFSFTLKDGNQIVTDGEKYLSLGKTNVNITVNRAKSQFETGSGRSLRTYPFSNMKAPVPPKK